LRSPDGKEWKDIDGNLFIDHLVGTRIKWITPE